MANVKLTVGKNHSMTIPAGTQELVEGLLRDAGYTGIEFTAVMGKGIRGSAHTQGVKIGPLSARTAIELRIQPGDNGSRRRYFLRVPNGQDAEVLYDRLKQAAGESEDHDEPTDDSAVEEAEAEEMDDGSEYLSDVSDSEPEAGPAPKPERPQVHQISSDDEEMALMEEALALEEQQKQLNEQAVKLTKELKDRGAMLDGKRSTAKNFRQRLAVIEAEIEAESVLFEMGSSSLDDARQKFERNQQRRVAIDARLHEIDAERRAAGVVQRAKPAIQLLVVGMSDLPPSMREQVRREILAMFEM